MTKILTEKFRKELIPKKDPEPFSLKANRVLLEGLAGSGRTYFINKAIENILEDKNANTNFVLTSAHGDFSELSSKLLDLNYKLFVFNSSTEKKFVKIHKFGSTLSVSTYESDDEEIWNSLMTEPKTAVVVNISNIEDKDLYSSLVGKCINQLIAKYPLEGVNLITVFDDFEYLFDFHNLEKESNDKISRLIAELLEKHCDSDAEHFKIVFSGQNLSKMPVFSKFFIIKGTYQYINFSTDFQPMKKGSAIWEY